MAGAPVEFASVAPVLPTRDVVASLEHYRALGFDVDPYEDGDQPTYYGFAHWGPVDLHFALVDDHDPEIGASAVYLYVSDADALYARWKAADLPGRFTKPQDSDYGLREAAHVDPEGNLLRYGAWLPGYGPGA